MIPIFPVFKHLDRDDEIELKKITNNFDPYSDFDFAALWSWNIQDKVQISNLNDNLVIIFPEHQSGKLIYSYLGNNKLGETLQEIFSRPIIAGVPVESIELVPEVSLFGIDLNKYVVEIDLDSCDYIYDTSEHAELAGRKYNTKRRLSHKFKVDYPDVVVKLLDLTDEKIHSQIISVNDTWIQNKSDSFNQSHFVIETQALNRFLSAKFSETHAVGIYKNEKLIAYDLMTMASKGYAISHFSKTTPGLIGLNEFLIHEVAKNLKATGIKFINAEEDLGITNLRFTKNSYRPINFLRKYKITRY